MKRASKAAGVVVESEPVILLRPGYVEIRSDPWEVMMETNLNWGDYRGYYNDAVVQLSAVSVFRIADAEWHRDDTGAYMMPDRLIVGVNNGSTTMAFCFKSSQRAKKAYDRLTLLVRDMG